MRTPARVSADGFVRAYVEDRKNQVLIDGVLCCVNCKHPVKDFPAFLSLHAAEFDDCTGPGAVLVVKLSFCPNCEEPPDPHGCLHVRGML
jgi:hypothetical protein